MGKSKSISIIISVLAAVLIGLPFNSQAADFSWDGGSTSNNYWDSTRNWDSSNYPDSTSDTATINLSGASQYPVTIRSSGWGAETTIDLGSLTIGSNAGDANGIALLINGTLRMRGNISNAKTIQIAGTLQNYSSSSSHQTYTISGPGNISLIGGTISGRYSDTGWIFTQEVSGYGTISAPVANSASIKATGGTSGTNRTLTVSGNLTNNGTLQADQYNTLDVTGSLSNLSGGTLTGGTYRVLDTMRLPGSITTNAASIELDGAGSNLYNGSGTTNALANLATNNGTFSLKNGRTFTTAGAFTNAGTIELDGSSTKMTFTGNTSNSGTFTMANDATMQFDAAFDNVGGSQAFENLVISSAGYLRNAAADTITIKGDFENKSMQNTLWDTTAATLKLSSGANHNLYFAGTNMGKDPAGYIDNFAWDTLDISGSGTIYLFDGNTANTDSALYVNFLNGLTFSTDSMTITNDFQLGAGQSGDFFIYYLPTDDRNAYLNKGTYTLALGTGSLTAAPVPIPGTLLMLGTGLLGLLGIRRRFAAE